MTSRRSKRRLGEFALIARYFSPLATSPGALALQDDAALLALPRDCELVVTTDAIVEGVHFFPFDPPAMVAQKALRVNLSDLAAKGAAPLGYLMALALTDDCDLPWIRRFASGLANDQRTFGLSLLGGDTTRTVGALTIAITALGTVPRGGMITRAGAKAGDLVFVTGTIGDAGAGLQLLRNTPRNRSGGHLVGRYRRPTPRLSIGRGLVRVASAAIDVSDGLIADAGHIADCSGVQIAIDANRVPLSVAFRKQAGNSRRAVVSAVTSGDDYEIAFTCPQRNVPQLADLARKSGVPITAIGRVEKGKGVTLHSGKGRPIRLSRAGYTHF